MSNYPNECDRCGKDADLCAYLMADGEHKNVCPECWGWMEVEAEANHERWLEGQHDN